MLNCPAGTSKGSVVVKMPKSSVATKGISMVGATPSQFTTASTNAVEMRNCPMSFAFGVRPSERSFATFEASSMSPSTPVRMIASMMKVVSSSGAASKNTVIAIATSMTTPPMVGVPCFTRWLSGPSARTCCPIRCFFNPLIQNGMSTIVTSAPKNTARNTVKVGYCAYTASIMLIAP